MPAFTNDGNLYNDMLKAFNQLGSRFYTRDSVRQQFQNFFNTAPYSDDNYVILNET